MLHDLITVEHYFKFPICTTIRHVPFIIIILSSLCAFINLFFFKFPFKPKFNIILLSFIDSSLLFKAIQNLDIMAWSTILSRLLLSHRGKISQHDIKKGSLIWVDSGYQLQADQQSLGSGPAQKLQMEVAVKSMPIEITGKLLKTHCNLSISIY